MEQDLRDRFIALETSVSNFQDYYKENENRKHAENREDNRKVFDWLENLPCGANDERIESNKGSIAFNRYLIVGVLIIGVVLGLWVKLVMAG